MNDAAARPTEELVRLLRSMGEEPLPEGAAERIWAGVQRRLREEGKR